jgi:hypothetical protein
MRTHKGRRKFGSLHLGTSLALAGLLTSGAARAGAPPDIVAAMRACTTEQDDSRRLACYDHSLGRAPSEPLSSTAPKPQAQPVPTAPAAPALNDQFGMNPQVARKQPGASAVPPLKELRARVIAVSRRFRGEPVVTLENGQVWQAADGQVADWLKVGDVVTIWAGAMGSYYMAVRHESVRVSRVQ